MSRKNWKERLYDTYFSAERHGRKLSGTTSAGTYFQQSRPFIESYIKRFFPPSRESFIVDLACGAGAWIYYAKKMGYTRLQGCDVSPEQVGLARKLGIAEVQQGDISSFLANLSQPCDFILLIDILEHLEKQELFDLLDEIYGKLAEQGKILVHIPNAAGLGGMSVRYGDFTHETAFTPSSIKQVLTAIGFSDVQCYEEQPLIRGVKGLARNVLWRAGTLYYRLLWAAETGSLQVILSQNMTVVAAKSGVLKNT